MIKTVNEIVAKQVELGHGPALEAARARLNDHKAAYNTLLDEYKERNMLPNCGCDSCAKNEERLRILSIELENFERTIICQVCSA